jgi:hypothetical protein
MGYALCSPLPFCSPCVSCWCCCDGDGGGAGNGFHLCDLLHPEPRAWTLRDVPATAAEAAWLRTCGCPLLFDYIDTTNIADNTGILPLLVAAAPLLDPRNPKATLATDVLKGAATQCPVTSMLTLLGQVPLWLVPYALGVALDEVWLPPEGAPSVEVDASAWSCSGSWQQGQLMRVVHEGVPGSPHCFCWRTCGGSAPTPLAVRQSPALLKVLQGVVKGFAAPWEGMVCMGPTTLVRFLDALHSRGAVTDLVACMDEVLAVREWSPRALQYHAHVVALLTLHGLITPPPDCCVQVG